MEELKQLILNISEKDVWDKIVIISGVLSTLFLILTYLLARSINKKLNKPILEIQLKSVNRLLKSMQIQPINIHIYDKTVDGNIDTLSYRTIFNLREDKVLKEYAYYPVLVHKDDYNNMKLFEHRNDVFLPKKIADCIDELWFGDYKKATAGKINFSQFVLIYTNYDMEVNGIWEDEQFYVAVKKGNLNFNDIYRSMIKLRFLIQDWIDNPNRTLNFR